MQANRMDKTGDLEFAVFSAAEEEREMLGMWKWLIGGKGDPSPLSEADARLIAAAPDLYDLAKTLALAISYGLDVPNSLKEQCKEALEKARGK